ncbi:MAG: fibronectin type III domain-containing protein, partial [Bacteroidales bacterium]|nr:fibronectin type III domain-containing protein [Bacteroidales bacterium]
INACIKPALLVPAVFLLTVLGGNAEAQEYTCDFADAPFNSTQNPPAGQVSATYGARTFSLQGKEWKACACNKQTATAQLNLGRSSKQKNNYPPDQKFIDAGLDAKGATLEMNWDMERVKTVTFTFGTAKNVGGIYLFRSTDHGNTYEAVEVADAADGSISFTNLNSTVSSRYALGIETDKNFSDGEISLMLGTVRIEVQEEAEIICEAPYDLEGIDVDNNAMLDWKVPASGAPELGYEVVYQHTVTGSTPVSVLIQEPEILIENLIPGTYTWSVRSKCGANTYSEAVQGENFEIEAPTVPNVSPVMNEFYTVKGTQTLNKTLTFKAGHLTGDLSLSVKAEASSNGGQAVLQVSPSTVSKADAEAEGGFTITLTTDILEFDVYEDTLIFSDGDNILNKSVFMIEAVPDESVLLAESFNGCTGTSELHTLNGKADNLGWEGEKLYADNGAVKVGSDGTNGSLKSPTLDLRLQHGEFTVVFFAKSHNATEGKSLQVISKTEDGSTLTRDFTLTNAYARYETTFENGAASTTLTFQPKSGTTGRFSIDSVVVYQIAESSLSVKPISHIIYKNTEEDVDGATRHDTLNVRGAVLRQDVTVSCTNNRFEFSPALLDAEAV